MRWTLEVSADVEPKRSSARVKPTPTKRQRAKPVVKKTRVRPAASVGLAPAVGTPPAVETAPAVATAPAVETAPSLDAAPLLDTGRVQHPPAVSQPKATRLQAVILVAAAVLVIAVVAFPRGPALPVAAGSDGQPARQESPVNVALSTQPIAPAPAPSAAPPAVPVAVTPQAASEAPKKPSVQTVTKRTAASAKSPAPVAAAITDAPKKEDAAAPAAPPEPPPAPEAVATGNVMPDMVTITGCLEVSTSGDTFRLTDTEGVDAPKSRSWRSGFFKKRAAPVMIVDPSDPLALTKSVGKRVAATGKLASRELKLSSLHVVGPSCN